MPKRLVVSFALINILNYLDRYVLAAVLPQIMAEISLTKGEGGWLVAAFVPGYIIFSPIFGYVGDRFPRPKLMALGVVLWSVATLASGVATSFWFFVLARIFVGIGEASFGTIAPGYLKNRGEDPILVNRMLAVYYSAIPIGTALGFVTGGLMAEAFSWRSAFYVAGAPGIIAGIMLFRLPEIADRKVAAAPLWQGVKEIAAVPVLWFVMGGYILNTVALNGVASFLTDYGTSIGFGLDEIGTYFGIILVVAGAGGTFGGGQISSFIAKNADNPTLILLRFVGISALLGTPFLFAAFMVEGKVPFLLCSFVAEVFIFAGIAPINAILVSACPPQLVTLTQGMAILLINLFGSLPSPVYVGYLADITSLRFSMGSLGVFLMLSGLVWTFGSLRVRVPHPNTPEEIHEV